MADALVPMRVLVNGWAVDRYYHAGEQVDVPAAYVDIFEIAGFAARVPVVNDAEAETGEVPRSRRRTRSPLHG